MWIIVTQCCRSRYCVHLNHWMEVATRDQRKIKSFLLYFCKDSFQKVLLWIQGRTSQPSPAGDEVGTWTESIYFFIFFVMYCLLFKKGFLKFHKSPLEWFHHICTMKYIRNRWHWLAVEEGIFLMYSQRKFSENYSFKNFKWT